MNSKQQKAVATWQEIMCKVSDKARLSTNERYVYEDIIKPYQKHQMSESQAVIWTNRIISG